MRALAETIALAAMLLVLSSAARADVARGGIVLDLDSSQTGIDGEVLRSSLKADLRVPILAVGGGVGQPTLALRRQSETRVTIAFHGADGREVERTIDVST